MISQVCKTCGVSSPVYGICLCNYARIDKELALEFLAMNPTYLKWHGGYGWSGIGFGDEQQIKTNIGYTVCRAIALKGRTVGPGMYKVKEPTEPDLEPIDEIIVYFSIGAEGRTGSPLCELGWTEIHD